MGMLLSSLILYLSFAGLCEGSRALLKLNRSIAPFFASCGIIVVMMLAGFANILAYGAYALYALGFIGWIIAIVKRQRPAGILLLAGGVLIAVLYLLLGDKKIMHNDDLSHWDLVVNSMLRTDAFPNASDPSVVFQSYPLGTGVFLYYVAKFVGTDECVRLIAQNFLCAVSILPMLSCIREKKKLLPFCCMTMAMLYLYMRYFVLLQVDMLLGYMGIGLICSIYYERENGNRMLLAAIPAVLAVTWVKNSGFIFAAVGFTFIFMMLKQSGSASRRKIVKTAILTIGLSLLALIAWEIHVKIAFPSGFESKHAISLTSYASNAGKKSLRLIIIIAIKMVIALFTQNVGQPILLIAVAGVTVFVVLYHKKHPSEGTKHLMQDVLFGVGCFVAWQIMIYAMYIFSMPTGEASRLASYGRYTHTGLLFVCGIVAVFLLEALDCDVVCISAKPAKWAKIVSPVVMAVTMAINITAFTVNTDSAAETIEKRERLLSVKTEQNLSEGAECAYLAYIGERKPDEDDFAALFRNTMRHDFASRNVYVMYYSDEKECYRVSTSDGSYDIEDTSEWISENAPKMDGIIFIEENDELIEEARSAAPGRVYAAWEESEESDSEMKRPVQVCLHRTILT